MFYVFVFFLPSNHFARQILRRTEESIDGQILLNAKTNSLEPVHPTDFVVFRTCQLVVSSLFGQSQSFISTDSVDRFHLEFKTGPNPNPQAVPETAKYSTYACLYSHDLKHSMDEPVKVADPARGQLNRENEYFPVPVRA